MKHFWSGYGSTTLDDPRDVDLSLHAVDYLAGAEKVNGIWQIYVRFFDTYDFDYKLAGDYGPAELKTWINNYAYEAQEMGALVNYDIVAYTQDRY